jgi:GNAT superfamily N-acetyltransferase
MPQRSTQKSLSTQKEREILFSACSAGSAFNVVRPDASGRALMPFRLEVAAPEDAAAIAALRSAAADALTRVHGRGHWSHATTERGVLFDMKRSTVYIARRRGRIAATLTLSTRKPWAIDRRYFTDVKQPLYLVSMAVDPAAQRRGLGRRCVAEAKRLCRAWPADSLCLDAYDTDAGAGEFYRKCGFAEVGRASYRDTPLIYFELLL